MKIIYCNLKRLSLTFVLFVTLQVSAQTPVPLNFTLDEQSSLARWNPPDTAGGTNQLMNYLLLMDGLQLATTTDTVFDYGYFWFGSSHTAGIAAVYDYGNSDTISLAFTSEYLIPPAGLLGDVPEDFVYLEWEHPVFPGNPDSVPANLLGYTIYKDGDSIGSVSYPDKVFYELNPDEGEFLYSVSAEYDLTPYGSPGETGFSSIEGPVELTIVYCCSLPFSEMWGHGNFSTLMWEVDCDNWSVSPSYGNAPPAAVFQFDESLTNYSCGINSMNLGQDNLTEGLIFLDFDLRLEDLNNNGTELFKVYVISGEEMYEVFSQSNSGGFEWKSFHIDISEHTLGNPDYSIYFVAEGINAENIQSWGIDNILVYFECPAPYDLSATTGAEFIQLMWESSDTLSGKSLSGYQIFREHNSDGEWVLLNEEPVLETTYNDYVSDTGVYKYYVEAEFENCHSNPSNVVEASVYLGINEKPDVSFGYFPNPADEYAVLHSDIAISEVQVLDLSGREIIKVTSTGNKYNRINTAGLPEGIYLINSHSETGVRSSKLIVQHH